MKYDFDTPASRTGNGNMKGGMAAGLPEDAVFLAGAEMDYGTAPCIRTAIQDLAKNGLFGFSLPDSDYRASICHWMQIARNWTIAPAWIIPAQGTISALSTAIRAFTQPYEGVIIQHPSYYRFDRAVLRNGRRVVPNPMIEANSCYTINWQDLEQKMADSNNTFMILCNPHNPTSRVFNRTELEHIAALAAKYNVVVFSDEIFAETAQPGYEVIPYVRIDPQGITSTSLGKTFNLTGVNHANLIIPAPDIRTAFKKQQDIDHFGSIDPFFYNTVRAAYTEEGLDWVRAMNEHTRYNYDLIQRTLLEQMPKLTLSPLEGTFIVWMDCRRIGSTDFFDDAHVYVDPGEEYGPCGNGFVRFNIASPTPWIEKALKNLQKVYQQFS